MDEFKKCVKKPIIVSFRNVRPDETGIETLEGYKPCTPEEHYIMRGIDGELYPIRKEIFDKTYDILEDGRANCPFHEYRLDIQPIIKRED